MILAWDVHILFRDQEGFVLHFAVSFIIHTKFDLHMASEIQTSDESICSLDTYIYHLILFLNNNIIINLFRSPILTFPRCVATEYLVDMIGMGGSDGRDGCNTVRVGIGLPSG